MKPSELRIGNLVYDTERVGTEFYIHVIEPFDLQQHNSNCMLPIPLDAEWLERLQMPDGVFSGNEYFSVAPLNSNPKVYGLYFEDEYTGMDFSYVHDLQNFSALTGTELTKKEI